MRKHLFMHFDNAQTEKRERLEIKGRINLLLYGKKEGRSKGRR